MVRIQRTPRYPVGTRVLKHFHGYPDPFRGTVDRFLTESGFYHITYDDGDSEEMTEEDVETHFHSNQRKKAATASASVAVSTSKPAKPVKTKTLLLSGIPSTPEGAVVVVNGRLNDTETAVELLNDEDDDDAETVVDADAISELVNKKVCKLQVQADGSKVVMHGTVLTYFPATKMYRIVYTNRTTDDMTYREVIDSMPVSPLGVSSKRKRKSLDAKAPSASPKKRKMLENEKPSDETPTADENTNRENVPAMPSVFTMPSLNEESFVWNRTRAYDMVRCVLYVVTSTSSTASKATKALEQPDVKAKKALELFVQNGGLTSLQELLTQWSTVKDNEPGVLAILKVLAVIPGVTSDAVRESRIGITLNQIRKSKGITEINPVVQDIASWIIKKWKKEIVGEDSKTEKDSRPAKTTSTSDTKSKSGKISNGSNNTNKTESSSKPVASHKRSNSANHLLDLLGSEPRSNSRNGDLLGNGLASVRPSISRPLGAANARRPRRSTVLLDSIADRVSKNTEAEKRASGSSGSRATAVNADGWTASRVRFEAIATLEFDKDHEVSMLLEVAASGRIRPASTLKVAKSSTKFPDLRKQPAKSILRVKLGKMEQEAIAAEARAHEGRPQEMALLAFAAGDSEHKKTAVSIRDDGIGPKTHSSSLEFPGDVDEELDDATLVAPPSPPRKHDSSEDDDNASESPPLLDDLMVDVSPDGSMPAVPVHREHAPSPVVSPDAPSSPESGEILDDGDTTTLPPPPPPHSPPQPHVPSPDLPPASPSIDAMPSPPQLPSNT